MNIPLIITCSLALASSSPQKNTQELLRQTAAQKPAVRSSINSGTEKIDVAKEADIRNLLELSGAKGLIQQSMQQMEQNIKPLLANSLPPGGYREKLIELFFAKFHSKADTQQLLNLIVPVYDRYLSGEEIKGLIGFYRTPLGQKTITALPKLMAEAQDEGRKWGEDLGRQCMMELMNEHPEFIKQIEDAQKTAYPQQ